jgi:hypothetical protein
MRNRVEGKEAQAKVAELMLLGAELAKGWIDD